MADKLFDPPRWPDAPKICIAENLPAFKTENAMNDAITTDCPTISIATKYQCTVCHHWHFETKKGKRK